jgi:hypothetical protein
MMESRKCIKCREIINPLRIKALPTAKTCVECSTTGAKRGVPMMFGEKDHTWTDMVIMESDEYEKYEKQQNQTISFDILDKSEMNSDGNEEEDRWEGIPNEGLENI